VVDGGDTDFSTLFAGTTITLVPEFRRRPPGGKRPFAGRFPWLVNGPRAATLCRPGFTRPRFMRRERRNLYRLLHVQPEAPPEVIKAAWRALMSTLRAHPDLGATPSWRRG
jgi:hypothetical protein